MIIRAEEQDIGWVTEEMTQFSAMAGLSMSKQELQAIVSHFVNNAVLLVDREARGFVAGEMVTTEFGPSMRESALWVAKEKRSRGKAKELMLELENLASEQGAQYVLVGSMSEESAKLFASLDYQYFETLHIKAL